MKTLRKVSFENFERLTIVEASQLYGGTGDNPPPTSMPTDSIPPNKNDSIPPIKTDSIPSTPPVGTQKKAEHSVGVNTQVGPGKEWHIGTSYNYKKGNYKGGITLNHGSKGTSFIVSGEIKF